MAFTTLCLITVVVAAPGLGLAVAARNRSIAARNRSIAAIAPCVSALALAVLIGYTDQHTDEVWAALFLILPSTFIFGFLLPRRAWLWAFIIGGGVIGGSFVGLFVASGPPCHPGFGCPPPSLANSVQAFVALIPAFIGAYAGALARWSRSVARSQNPEDGRP